MSGKRIYSNETKIEVAQRYQTGDISILELAKEFHVNNTDVQKWSAIYKEHGVEGLTKTSRTYSGDFKLAVVKYIQDTGASSLAAAAHFNIKSSPTVSKWERIYYEEGAEALYEERRGRASEMATEKKGRKKKNVNENEDLLAENERLRMENDYLKKLIALVQKREESEKKRK